MTQERRRVGGRALDQGDEVHVLADQVGRHDRHRPGVPEHVRELVLLVPRVDEQGADSRERAAEQDVHVVEAIRHQHRDGVAACDPEPCQGGGHPLGRGQCLVVGLAGLREHDGVGAATTQRLPHEQVAECCCLYPAARPGLAHSGSAPPGWAER